jgi:hypothetical protein
VSGLLAIVAGYLAVQLRRTPGAACGCFGDDEPTSQATVVRAVLLSLAAASAALILPSVRVAVDDVALALVVSIPLVLLSRRLPTMIAAGRRSRR